MTVLAILREIARRPGGVPGPRKEILLRPVRGMALVAATLEATLLQPDQAAPRDEYLEAMEELSNHAYRAYRSLVYETAGFERYFWESTVVGEIANLNIGSRPARRKGAR